MNKENKLLNINKFIIEKQYNINDIYFDRFYKNINNKHWIYVDETLIKWIGYKQSNGKFKFIDLIKKNFNKTDDYLIYNYDEILKIIHSPCEENETTKEIINNKEQIKNNLHNRTNHIILSPRCFKKSLMIIKTKKAEKIRDYYVDIEDIFKDYLEYQNEYKNNQLKEKDKTIENIKNENRLLNENLNNKKKLEKNEYIYVITNNQYYKQNLYKIGRTTCLKSRLTSHNTMTAELNMNYYCYIFLCHNSEKLESFIFHLLKPFHHKNEIYNLHFIPLIKIIHYICINYDNEVNEINKFIDNYNDIAYSKIAPKIQLEPINHNNIKELNTYLNFNIKSELNNNSKINFNNIQDSNNKDKTIQTNKLILEKDEIKFFIYKGLKLFICNNCNKIFKSNYQLKIHNENTICIKKDKKIILNTEQEVEQFVIHSDLHFYPCNKCKKRVFLNPSDLKRHHEANRKCDEIYNCQNCYYIFPTKSRLEKHKLIKTTCIKNKHLYKYNQIITSNKNLN